MNEYVSNDNFDLEAEPFMQQALFSVGILTFRYYSAKDVLVLSNMTAEYFNCPKIFPDVMKKGIAPLILHNYQDIFIRMLDFVLRGNESASEKLVVGESHQFYNVSITRVDLEEETEPVIVGIIENPQFTLRATEMVRALSDNYETIIYADLNTEVVIPYRVHPFIEKSFGSVFSDRLNFSYIINTYVNTLVVPSEREEMLEVCSVESIKTALKTSKFFVYDYTINKHDYPTYWRMKIVKLSEDSLDRVVIGFADVSKEKTRELERYAYVDSVTNGDNYIRFKERMMNAKSSGYIVAMDIHSFKIINSVCGISKGDETIREIWKSILKILKENDLAAHINADHFIMFFAQDDKTLIEERVQRLCNILDVLSDYLEVPKIMPYFGAAKWDNSRTVELVYSDANTAKREIKERSDLNLAFYSKEDSERLMAQKAMEDAFESSIRNRSFEVWYQPKYDPVSGKMVGAEALIRWRGKDGKLISPGSFIPLFEKNGMIRFLDEYVFRSVCLQQKTWELEGLKPIPISVNLSRASLYFSNVVEQYKSIIDSINIDPKWIPIEITESAAVANGNIKQLADQFYQAGFLLHIDDFGSGYSSLATLNLLHFDTLKIDKALIDYIGNYGGERLLHHTISLAKELGMKVCAEGVEKIEQVEFLRNLNCNSIQGFYYSKPIPVDEFVAIR